MAGKTRSRSASQKPEKTLARGGRPRSTSANEHASRKRNVTPRSRQERSTRNTTAETEKLSPRKRKGSVSPSAEGPTKVLKRTLGDRVIDAYCWVCHKACSEVACDRCPRAYHEICIKKLKLGNSNLSPICECLQKTVDSKNEDLNLERRTLKKLLQSVMQMAIKDDKKNGNKLQKKENSKYVRLFQAWPIENEMCKIMDLNILIDNMNGEKPYTSTGQFFLDVKWIHHNCCILHGFDHDITDAANKMEKNFRMELTDLEACAECYSIKHSDHYLHNDFFTKVCSNPHPIVWAKLRGSPFWPAKCLKFRNGHLDVRFFGTHDKSNIPSNKCYRISRQNPLNKTIHQAKYQESMRELSIYVSNYECRLGPFEYFPLKTKVDGLNTNSKKNNRKDGQRVNNTGQVSRNMPSPDVKIKSFFPNLSNSANDDRNNQNISECVEENGVSDILCQMDFSADEEPDGPANENTESSIDNSSPYCTLSQASLNPTLSLSVDKTLGLISTAGVLSSNDLETTTEAEQNDTTLPVISSVSTTQIPSREDLRASSSLPVITSTMSRSGNCAPTSDESNTKVRLNSLLPVSSTSMPSLTRGLKDTVKASLINLLNIDDENDEVQVIDERKSTTVKDLESNPFILQTLTEILFGLRPEMKACFRKFNTVILRYFVLLFVEFNFSRIDPTFMSSFLDVSKKFLKENSNLTDKLSGKKKELETVKKEFQTFKTEAEKAKLEAEKIISKKDQEIAELKRKVQEQNPNFLITDLIIQTASQKIQDREARRNAPESMIDALTMELEEAKQKILIKDEDLKKFQAEVERLQTLICGLKDTCDAEVQTEESILYDKEIPDSVPANNQNQDSSQLTGNHVHIPYEGPSSSRNCSCSCSDVQVELQRETIVINQSVSSETTYSSLNVDVVQHMFEQNLMTSDCTAMISAPNSGVMTAASPAMMSVPTAGVMTAAGPAMMSAPTASIITAACPTVMSVPLVLPSNPIIHPSGTIIQPSGTIFQPSGPVTSSDPVFLDAESSASFVKSMNDSQFKSKSKSKFANQTKVAKRRKKNF